MEAQTLIVLLIVVGAAFYMSRRLFRAVRSTRTDADGCASGCGCETNESR